MPRRRRSYTTVTQAQMTATTSVIHQTAPAVVRQDLLRLATVYAGLVVLLGLAAYWQRHSSIPTQIGHALRLFAGF